MRRRYRQTAFADTHYWIALSSPNDRHHQRALELRQALRGVPLLTTDGVLAEYLAYFADQGAAMREAASQTVRDIYALSHVEVVEMSRQLFLAGLELYEQRPDKEYSLVDCVSMTLMKERGVFEALTHDHHFEQEGFIALIDD
jgi:uncharacterized protein